LLVLVFKSQNVMCAWNSKSINLIYGVYSLRWPSLSIPDFLQND